MYTYVRLVEFRYLIVCTIASKIKVTSKVSDCQKTAVLCNEIDRSNKLDLCYQKVNLL